MIRRNGQRRRGAPSSSSKPTTEKSKGLKSLTKRAGVVGAPAVVLGPTKADLPRSVHACAEGKYHLSVWRRGQPDAKKCVPFRCKSWRHEGECREMREAIDTWRIKQALEREVEAHGLGALLWGVLTFDQRKYADLYKAFELLGRNWQSLRQAVERKFGAVLGHVSTVEAHRSGWPHLNVILVSPGLGAAMEAEPRKTLKWWKSRAVSCGLGKVASLEAVRLPDKVAAYIAKLSTEVGGDEDGSGQVPVNAPPHFRRLRASQGFLPPPPKNPEWTGELVRAPLPAGTPVRSW